MPEVTPDPSATERGAPPGGMVQVGWWHEKSGFLNPLDRFPAGLLEPLGDRYDLCPVLPVFAPEHDHATCLADATEDGQSQDDHDVCACGHERYEHGSEDGGCNYPRVVESFRIARAALAASTSTEPQP